MPIRTSETTLPHNVLLTGVYHIGITIETFLFKQLNISKKVNFLTKINGSVIMD